MEKLMRDIEKWSKTYEFNFQFWGYDKNNVFIYKNGVELFCFGDSDSIEEVVKEALNYVYRINKVDVKDRAF